MLGRRHRTILPVAGSGHPRPAAQRACAQSPTLTAWGDRVWTRSAVAALKEREDAAFVAARPRGAGDVGGRPGRDAERRPDELAAHVVRPPSPLFIESASGSRLRDVDGHEYADFNIADMSMFTGYGSVPVTEAVARQVAIGSQYLLPTEDSIWVAGELGRRYGLPLWQFTLAATSANTEVIRVARSITGRERVLFFDGKYHGHFDDVLVEIEDGRLVPGGGRPPARRHGAHRHRALQRPRRPRACARRPRRRGGHHRAGPDQQRGPPAARRRVPRGSARARRDGPARCWPTTRRTRRSSGPAA